MIIRFFLSAGFCLLYCMTSVAQIHFRKLPFEWQLHLGGSYFNAPELNALTNAYGLRSAPPFGLNLALALSYRFGNMIVGGNVANSYGFRGEDQLRSTSISAFVSTNLIHAGKWTISPTLGIGPQFSTAVFDQGEVVGEFGEFLGNRGNQTRLTNTVTAVDLGLTFKTYDLLTASYRSKFRVGYQTGVHRAPWQVGTTELVGAPRDRTGIVYLQFSTGIGY